MFILCVCSLQQTEKDLLRYPQIARTVPKRILLITRIVPSPRSTSTLKQHKDDNLFSFLLIFLLFSLPVLRPSITCIFFTLCFWKWQCSSGGISIRNNNLKLQKTFPTFHRTSSLSRSRVAAVRKPIRVNTSVVSFKKLRLFYVTEVPTVYYILTENFSVFCFFFAPRRSRFCDWSDNLFE